VDAEGRDLPLSFSFFKAPAGRLNSIAPMGLEKQNKKRFHPTTITTGLRRVATYNIAPLGLGK
jgi:hypothetical protein